MFAKAFYQLHLGRKLSITALHILLLIGIIISIMPFYWMFSSSFKTSGDIWIYPRSLFPASQR